VTGLETERLRGEPITMRHHDALSELLGDPRVGATLGGVADRETVKEFIAHELDHWSRHGFGYWIWFDRATGEPVGRGGLHHAHVGGRDEIEVGWTVWPSRWGEGLATELGDAVVSFGFEQLELDTIVSYTLVDNRASRRVMEKLGMSLVWPGFQYGGETVLYELLSA
jgi:[ribosomal protein S5]-alanine N-acetyltransferase